MIVMKFGGSSVDGAAAIERVAGIVRDRLPAASPWWWSRRWRRRPAGCSRRPPPPPPATARARSPPSTRSRRTTAASPTASSRRPAGRRWTRRSTLPSTSCAPSSTRSWPPARSPRARPTRWRGTASCWRAPSSPSPSATPTPAIDAAWVDCRRVIVTDHDFTRARPLYGPTDARLRETLLPLLRAGRVPVLGGYVGATLQGVTTTLGKEGSDFSAAIVGAALGAEEVLIWTDVDGMRTADPRLFPGARRVRTLSFAEALELSCSGAKKPHYGTLGPASRANVPIRILDSRHPEAEGTTHRPPPSARAADHQVDRLPDQRPSDLGPRHRRGRGRPARRRLRGLRAFPPVAAGAGSAGRGAASSPSTARTGWRRSTRRCSRRWGTPPSSG